MNVIVKGMQMPTNCGNCPFRLAWCRERIYMVTRTQRCPLIELPDHGRLVDADEMERMFLKATGISISFNGVPTVIPAERSGE